MLSTLTAIGASIGLARLLVSDEKLTIRLTLGRTILGATSSLIAGTNGYTGNMKDLPLDLAKTIYRKQYWTAPRFDQVNLMSSKVAEKL